MKAMILAYEAPADFERRRVKHAFETCMAPWKAYSQSLAAQGVLLGGAALEGPETATTISVRGGKRKVEDGPFADSKEQLGGYFIVAVKDIDEAVRLAKGCPAAATGRVEVRVIPDFGPDFGQGA